MFCKPLSTVGSWTRNSSVYSNVCCVDSLSKRIFFQIPWDISLKRQIQFYWILQTFMTYSASNRIVSTIFSNHLDPFCSLLKLKRTLQCRTSTSVLSANTIVFPHHRLNGFKLEKKKPFKFKPKILRSLKIFNHACVSFFVADNVSYFS